MSDFLSDLGKAVSDGVNAAAEAVSDGVNAATEAVSDGVDAAGRAVSRGLDAVNNACNKASDPVEGIIETVVSSPDILADRIADSIVGQYWSDFWDHNVESVNAIEGLLKDTAEELANDEDVPDFIRDYMNGYIGADVPCNFFGVLGTGCRGAEETVSGVYKGASGVLGHPCQTEENIADALIIAGEATGYFIGDPPEATKNAINSVSGWWNEKNTYEKIRTVVEAYIMYRMIASSRAKGETVTLESEEAAGVAGETAEIASEAGETGGIAAGEKAAGKGKIRIKSAGENGSKPKWWHEGYVDNLSDTQIVLGVKQSDKGLSTLGSATRENVMSAGKTWVGDNYKIIKDNAGNVLGYSSADGMRAFRIQYKPKEGMWRANFQENIMVNNPYPNPGRHSSQLKNVHIDILD